MNLKFWYKTLQFIFSFGNNSYYKQLKNLYNPNYNFDTDKHPIRNKHNGKMGWSSEKKKNILHRNYESYEEYVMHQKQKFNEIISLKGAFSKKEITSYRLKFYRRFRHFLPILPKSAKILCAGARQGTEVEVLRDLGFENAFGIDLNPGPNNKLVVKGDFMNLNFKDNSIDAIYSNCIDHAFNLNDFFREQARVLKPEGYAIYDISQQEEGGPFEAVEWESDEQIIDLIQQYFGSPIKIKKEKVWTWILFKGKK